MGQIRLWTLPRSRKWRDVVEILESGADVLAVAEAAVRASERALNGAVDDHRAEEHRETAEQTRTLDFARDRVCWLGESPQQTGRSAASWTRGERQLRAVRERQRNFESI